jgi:hypothetical protein
VAAQSSLNGLLAQLLVWAVCAVALCRKVSVVSRLGVGGGTSLTRSRRSDEWSGAEIVSSGRNPPFSDAMTFFGLQS